MNIQEKDKISAIENDSETTTYKPKGKREKYSDSETQKLNQGHIGKDKDT